MKKLKQWAKDAWVKIDADLASIVGSLVRAEIGFVGTVQVFDVFNARGWQGLWEGSLVALTPPLMKAWQVIRKDISDSEPKDGLTS